MTSVSRVDLSRPYFIGIGGIGMSGLAKIFVHRGARVAGSDVKEMTTVIALRQIGCEVHIGHDSEHILDPSCVVTSQAVRESNIELQAARCARRSGPASSRCSAVPTTPTCSR